MTISALVAAFIAKQREVLTCLEQFAQSHQYRRLPAVAAPMVDGDAEPWLSEWLIQPPSPWASCLSTCWLTREDWS